jgi:hypothetical protein
MKWKITAVILIIILITVAVYSMSINTEFQPLGRLSFVKISNPDMYSGSPHSKLAAKYAHDRGSNTVLVVHLAGHTTGYPNYMEGDVLIEELGFQDSATNYKENNNLTWLIQNSIQILLFGVPDGRFRYVSDGIVFNNLSDALKYLDEKTVAHRNKGKTLLLYHGTARGGSPEIMVGCGVPLYFQVLEHEYGRVGSYYYLLYELQNAQNLQNEYNKGQLDLQTAPYD